MYLELRAHCTVGLIDNQYRHLFDRKNQLEPAKHHLATKKDCFVKKINEKVLPCNNYI